MSVTLNYELRQDLKMLVDEASLVETPLVAPILAPECPVTQDSAKAATLPKGELSKVPFDTRRNQDGSFNSGGFSAGEIEYSTEEHGWDQRIDDVQRLLNLDYFDTEVVSSKIAVAMIKLNREVRIADAYQTEANFGARVEGVTAPWDDLTNAKPYTDIKALSALAFEHFGMKKEMLDFVVHKDMADMVIRSNEVRAGGQYLTNIDLLTEDQIAQYLRQYLKVKRVILVDGVYNDAGLGISVPKFSEVWSPDFAALVYPAGNQIFSPGFCKQPVYTPYAKDYNLYSYPIITHKKTVIHCEEYRGVKTDYSYGVMLKGLKS